ncbi:MAG: TIGR03619 family F420-dependent LLM class oxidoreductase [Jatrophihabitans sp.]
MTGRRTRVGVHLPNYGTAASDPGMAAMAQVAERAGMDSIWLSDHIVLFERPESRYPFSTDGEIYFPPDSDWLEWTVTAGYLAAVTEHIEIGVGVLPLRHPLLLAKQVATLDLLSNHRIVLGVGTGWLLEEFDALGVEWAARGARADGALRLLRAAWTGRPAAGDYGPYSLPDGVICAPAPGRDPLPIYVGGVSAAALQRVARYGQGWYGTGVAGQPDPVEMAHLTQRIADECAAIGRDHHDVDVALRVSVRAAQIGSPELADRLGSYLEAGADRFCLDLRWTKDLDLMGERLADLGGWCQTAPF